MLELTCDPRRLSLTERALDGEFFSAESEVGCILDIVHNVLGIASAAQVQNMHAVRALISVLHPGEPVEGFTDLAFRPHTSYITACVQSSLAGLFRNVGDPLRTFLMKAVDEGRLDWKGLEYTRNHIIGRVLYDPLRSGTSPNKRRGAVITALIDHFLKTAATEYSSSRGKTHQVIARIVEILEAELAVINAMDKLIAKPGMGGESTW
jgi:hypothetical protein